MEIELLIQKKKELYSSLMEFIDATENNDINLLIKFFEEQDILQDKDETITIFQLLSKIADNHHFSPDYIDKFRQIILYLIQAKNSNISDFEIYKIFRNNKRILLLFLEQGFIEPDEKIISDIKKTKDENYFPYSLYLYSGIKSFIDKNEIKEIESEIKEKYGEEIASFEEKCRIGENDSYICSLIRQDAVEEFISYVNRTQTSLSSKIQPSIFETNSFLMEKTPTLIEYATFFGSIQIIQYLRYSKVPLTDSLWLYAIHSNNAEIIHLLEENEIKPEENYKKKPKKKRINRNKRFKFPEYQQSIAYEKFFEESIICHHNAIADYIKDNYLNNVQIDYFGKCITDCFNYYYFPIDIGCIISNSVHNNGFNISQLCFSLTQITTPSSVTSIGKSAFSGCSSLTQITFEIPSSVTSIGDSAFSECSSLTQITIPSSVTSIGESAFSECSSLTQITIPSSVASIGDSTFSGCKKLDQIKIIVTNKKNIKYFENKLFISKSNPDNENYDTLIWAKPTLSIITIPIFIKYIRNSAFSECSPLTQITIPSSMTSIGDYHFSGCSSLKQIIIPSSITSIGNEAFRECSSLTQITFEITSSVTSFGNYAFFRCSSLTQITIPSSVTSIGEHAFNVCSSLTQITIPSSVTSIGKYAFAGCSSLTYITFEIPSSLTSIEECTFYGCSSLTEITIPSSVTSIGSGSFIECSSLTQITFEIPSSVTKIENIAFLHCTSLSKITFPSSMKSIGESSFFDCKSLKEVFFEDPASLISIEDDSFGACPLLPLKYIPTKNDCFNEWLSDF